MTNTERGHMKAFEVKCREHRLRVTPQRTIIYRLLLGLDNHPSVDEVFALTEKTFPNISFDTVYRTLNSFAKIGLIKEVEGYGKPKRFDTDTENHHHMHCVKCGKIVDFCDKEYDNIKVPGRLKKEFRILSKKVILEGLCGECIKREKTKKQRR
jgi:Fur family peroxide stress response transcriptional regulator